MPTTTELNQRLDSMFFKPDATRADIEKICAEARQLKLAAVCINGSRVIAAAHCLEDSPVQIAAMVGFPFGTVDGDVKRYEAETAIDHGAQEIEVVLNMGFLKDGNDRAVFRELRDVVESVDERIVRVVLEIALLNEDEIKRAALLSVEADAHGICTSAGLGSGADADTIHLLRETVGPKFDVKVAGGIRTAEDAQAALAAGASRIGTLYPAKVLGVSPATA